MKTRLLVTGFLVAVLAMGLAGCGQQQQGESSASTKSTQAATAEFATLGDVFALETEQMSSTFDEKHYVCAFSSDGTWWRVEADLEEGMYDKLNEVWAEDQAKVEELLAPIAVTKAEALEPISDDELAALEGKTGADLTADDFEFSVGTVVVNGNETDCVATKGSFDYLVTFGGKVADEDTDDPAGAVADLTVKTVAVQGASWSVLDSE